MNKLILTLAVIAPLAIPTASSQASVTDGLSKSPATVVDREAAEGPRGKDNEKPGDRQRGRGK